MNNEEKEIPEKWWSHPVAGAVAGAISRTSTAPFERIKVYFQVYGTKKTTIISSVNAMIKDGGLRSLWRGNGTNVLKIIPEYAIKFSSYETMKKCIRTDINQQNLTLFERFIAGSVAGGVSQAAIYPLEVLKIRLELVTSKDYKGLIIGAKNLYATYGARAFYRGFLLNLLGAIPFTGIDFALYESLKNEYINYYGTQKLGVFPLLFCGLLSSTCGQFTSYPFLLVKTKLIAQDGIIIGYRTESARKICIYMFKQEGLRGFYRGFFVNVLKVAPAVSIAYVVYENLRIFLDTV